MIGYIRDEIQGILKFSKRYGCWIMLMFFIYLGNFKKDFVKGLGFREERVMVIFFYGEDMFGRIFFNYCMLGWEW